MSPAYVDRHIIDHGCRWSRTGHDGARLDRSPRAPQAVLQQQSDINPVIAIGRGPRIVSLGQPDPCQPRRPSAPAAPPTTTKSP